jgi:hypothetical protein
MTRRNPLMNVFLLSLTSMCLNSSCNGTNNEQAIVQPPKPERNNAENLKLIFATAKEELNHEADKVVQIGERLISIANGKQDIGDSTSYIFNNKQQQVQKQVYNYAGKPKETTTYKYDTINNLISINAKNYDGGSPFAIIFSYNKNGQIISTKTTSSIENNNEKYKYNELNYLTETKVLNNNKLWRTTDYSYDDRGNLVLTIVRSGSGDTVTIDKTVYNNLNQCIQREHSGEPFNCAGRNKWQIKYNASGDIIEEKTFDLTIRYVYEYDDKKNWTKKYHFYNNETEANYLIRRSIIYKD